MKILIKNATVFTMDTGIIENGYVLTENNIIKEVGQTPPEGSFDEIIDGGYVCPGFIDSHCHIGIFEDSLGFEGDDGNEETDPVTPHLRAIDAINPFDRSFKEALNAGVTTVVTGPGSANVFGGQMLAMKTYGKCIDEMVLKSPCAMKAALGENPKSVYHSKNQSPSTRMATAALIRETLIKAKNYKTELENYNEDSEENDKPDFDIKLDALIDVIDRKIPLKIHAHRADDIFTALRLEKEFGIEITLEHCTEGHLIPEYLGGKKIMVGPSLSDRSKPELKNLTFETAGILNKNSSVAVITDHPVIPIQYLPLCAALAFKFSDIDRYDALKMITINAARNCNIEEFVGSLSPGKHADILVFDAHPLDYLNSNLKYIITNGRSIIPDTSKKS